MEIAIESYTAECGKDMIDVMDRKKKTRRKRKKEQNQDRRAWKRKEQGSAQTHRHGGTQHETTRSESGTAAICMHRMYVQREHCTEYGGLHMYRYIHTCAYSCCAPQANMHVLHEVSTVHTCSTEYRMCVVAMLHRGIISGWSFHPATFLLRSFLPWTLA